MTTQTKVEQDRAIAELREIFPPGATAHTVIRHVTSSGMSRSISVLQIANGQIYDISYLIKRAIGWKIDPRNGGVKVTGCGMDMAFHLVYTLAEVLYGDGYAISQRHV